MMGNLKLLFSLTPRIKRWENTGLLHQTLIRSLMPSKK